MKITASLLAAGLVLASACSSGDSTDDTAPSVTTAAPATDAPNTEVATTTTIEATTTTLSPAEAISFEIVEQTDTFTRLVVSDISGRNAAGISHGGAPETLNPRPIHVHIKRALGRDQSVVTDRAVPLQIVGGYHNDGNINCLFPSNEMVVACVGFPYMDNSKFTLETFDFRDIPNHPADVSRVLDVILANPDLTSAIDPERIYYFGGSMGGITGAMFVHPDFREPRLKAIISFIGASTFWLDELSDRANFDAAPPILMINKMKDTVLPYEWATLSFAAAQGSPKVQMVSVFDGDHAEFVTCPAVSTFQMAWVAHHVNGGPPPDPSVFDGSDCAAFGPQDGGTTGWGPRGDLLPDDAKAQFGT